MKIAELWRYPVKSMAGEQLVEAELGPLGIPGDRELVVVGEAVIALADLRSRCIMTTWDPDTIAQDRGVLARIRTVFEGTFALNAWVARPGRLRVGDPVSLLDTFDHAAPPPYGRYARR